MKRIDEAFEALRAWAMAATGKPAFVMYATGRPVEPYVVLEPKWYSEPDVGGGLNAEPAAYALSFTANSYGRTTTDALWLDEALYEAFIHDVTPPLDVEVLHLEADSSPVLTFTEAGHMLSKHMYRLTFR